MPLTDSRFALVEERIHGVLVRDPYRWLEDRSLPETEEWIREQQNRCNDYFANCGDLDVIRERVRTYLDIEIVDQASKVGSRYFYRRRDQGQEQASIYVRDALYGEERLLVDSSSLKEFVSFGIHRISEDGSLLAYELKQGGGDRKAIHIVDVESGRVLSDFIKTGYARGFSFTTDDRGFYYCHEVGTTSDDHTIRLHSLERTGGDQVCFRVARTCGSRLVLIADDIHLGAIHTRQLAGEGVIDFWMAQRSEPGYWRCILSNRTVLYSPMLKLGRIFALDYEQTPNGRLVELSSFGLEIRTIVPEQAAIILQLVIVGDKVFVTCMERMVPSIQCWSLAGENLGSLDIPADGTIQLLSAQSEAADSIFYSYEAFAQPLTIFEYRIGIERTSVWHRRKIPAMRLEYSLREATYRSKDGMPIPITIASRQKANLGQQHPVIMTGYGGFGVPMTPQFSVLVAIMMELGATFALPHIRGGGEFGENWHDAARGRKRQLAFDDFIWAAEWLCSEQITASNQLAIFGGSNSGLLVSAAMTQRPEFFRAVLCIAPLLDMVRYEIFDQAVKWRHEYGTVDDQEDFAALYAYSPYHHVAEGIDYPSVFFVSGDKDDRCNPAHVRKMAARLQECETPHSTFIVDYSDQRGHSPVLPLSVRVEALAKRIAFLCRELSLPIEFGEFHETTRD
jgi:prolyl oligopeptidase